MKEIFPIFLILFSTLGYAHENHGSFILDRKPKEASILANLSTVISVYVDQNDGKFPKSFDDLEDVVPGANEELSKHLGQPLESRYVFGDGKTNHHGMYRLALINAEPIPINDEGKLGRYFIFMNESGLLVWNGVPEDELREWFGDELDDIEIKAQLLKPRNEKSSRVLDIPDDKNGKSLTTELPSSERNQSDEELIEEKPEKPKEPNRLLWLLGILILLAVIGIILRSRKSTS